MAATPGGEESVYETGRLSLLDLIFEKNRAQNKVCYIALSLRSWYTFELAFLLCFEHLFCIVDLETTCTSIGLHIKNTTRHCR